MALEEDLILKGHWPVCGVDEAGRGPLAGPVVAAAVIIDPAHELRLVVKDSKKLSPAKREKIYERLISSQEIQIGVSMVDAATIDEMNILKATLKAMTDAVSKLADNPLYALVDGNIAPPLPCRCIPVIKGDQFEPSISAASIVAKVVRDRLMDQMDVRYPGYGFAKHKGYPTKSHYEAIRSLGVCPIHRRSFKGVC
ncbi:MAG TPA: ribonuclease HII [Deltaproteobacteria bacterium]|nr:ribonuclease HII [Deltaproteobacteria bacterium]HPR50250.1 ribonuclease HII [Deltaproteobacteria bacterium]